MIPYIGFAIGYVSLFFAGVCVLAVRAGYNTAEWQFPVFLAIAAYCFK